MKNCEYFDTINLLQFKLKQCSNEVDLLATAIHNNQQQMVSLKKQHVDHRNQNYLHLLKSGEFSDVTFEVAGQVFPGHKLILATHSPVFAAMFSYTDTKEAQEGKVVITDIEPEVFQELLCCIYSDTVVVKEFCVTELFVAADKVCLKIYLHWI